MAIEYLSVLRFAVVGSLPGTATQGDACVWSTNGHLYVYDGSSWIDTESGGVGIGGSGTATIDFGAAPGTNSATVAVTGQTSILATSNVTLNMMGDTTADHNAIEHQLIPNYISLTAGSMVAGTGFTITAYTELRLTGTFKVRWQWV